MVTSINHFPNVKRRRRRTRSPKSQLLPCLSIALLILGVIFFPISVSRFALDRLNTPTARSSSPETYALKNFNKLMLLRLTYGKSEGLRELAELHRSEYPKIGQVQTLVEILQKEKLDPDLLSQWVHLKLNELEEFQQEVSVAWILEVEAMSHEERLLYLDKLDFSTE